MATLTAFDLVLETDDAEVKLMVRRPPDRAGTRTGRPLSIVSNPVRGGDQFDQQEAEAVYSDFSGGAGYGERLARNVYHYGYPFYGRTPFLGMPPGLVTEVDVPPMRGPVRGAFTSRGDIFFAGGDRCLRIQNGSQTVYHDQFLDFFASFEAWSATNYGVEQDGYIGGTGGGLWRFNGDLNTWSQSTEVGGQFLATVYWSRGNSGSQKLVRSTVPGGPETFGSPTTSILYSDNPVPTTAAVWSDEILVGNPSFSITGLTASNQHLYVLKTNGLHDLDDRIYSPNITAYRQNYHEPGSPKALAVHNGHVYFGSQSGLGRVSLAQQGVRQDFPQQCGFGWGLPNYGPILGEPTYCVNENGWLATGYYNVTANQSYLCYGADYGDLGAQRPGVGGPLLWHGAEAVFDGQITHLYPCSPLGNGHQPRLYVWTWDEDSETARLFWVSLPQAGSPIQDLLAGGPMRFASEWQLVLPRETWGSDTSRKDQTLVSFRSDGLGSAVIDAFRSVEGGAFETESLGQASQTYDEFVVDAETNARDMAHKLVGVGGPTNPAMLKAFSTRAGVSVEASDTLTYLIEFGEGVGTHAAREQRGDPVWIEASLRAMQGRRATLTDNRRQQTYTVRVLQAMRLEWEEYPSGERTGRVAGVLTVQVLESLRRLDEGWTLDQGLRLA